jgi:hypothetical protein
MLARTWNGKVRMEDNITVSLDVALAGPSTCDYVIIALP